MHISQNVPASQSIDFSAFVESVSSFLRKCLLLQYEHSDCDVDSMLLGQVQVTFYFGFNLKEVHFHVSFTLRSQILQSFNER